MGSDRLSSLLLFQGNRPQLLSTIHSAGLNPWMGWNKLVEIPEDPGRFDLGDMRWDEPNIRSRWRSLIVLGFVIIVVVVVGRASWRLATVLKRSFPEAGQHSMVLVDVGRALLLLFWNALWDRTKDSLTGSAVNLLGFARAAKEARTVGLKRDVREGLQDEEGDYFDDLHCEP